MLLNFHGCLYKLVLTNIIAYNILKKGSKKAEKREQQVKPCCAMLQSFLGVLGLLAVQSKTLKRLKDENSN